MTKEERKIIYWAAMFEIEAFGLGNSGMCWVVAAASESRVSYSDTIAMGRTFPELYRQKPKKTWNAAYWFEPGNDFISRLTCLSKAIDLCD
jgi:hypothetical protein